MYAMRDTTPQRIGPHDLGGLPTDEVERLEQDIAFWEQRIDAMVNLLAKKGIITDWAQLRDGIETLSDDAYDSLSYYERWAAATLEILVKNNIVGLDEVKQKINSMRNHVEQDQ